MKLNQKPLRKGTKVKIIADTKYGHNLSEGSIVKILNFDKEHPSYTVADPASPNEFLKWVAVADIAPLK